ncbi:MAG TPA: SCO family protein [Oligoflexus sp.]|nr:SCO family protein [Oligoflexus sp.]
MDPIGQGLPFFTQRTLSPSWEQTVKAKANFVKMPPLSFRDQHDNVVSGKDLAGQTTFIAFFFSSCSGYCPFLLQNLKKVAHRLPQDDVRFVAISVDPEIDTPERLRRYAETMKLDARWKLLTGSKETVNQLVRETLVSQYFQRIETAERNFVHSEHFYVLDTQGYLRAVLNGNRLDVAEQAGIVLSKLTKVE